MSESIHSGIPYHPAFIAKVALEARTQPQQLQALSQRYALPEGRLAAWADSLHQIVKQYFGDTVSAKPVEPCRQERTKSDVRHAALDELDVSIAVLEGDELRYRYANKAYQAMAPEQGIIGRRLREVFPVSTTDGVESGLLEVLRTGQPWEVKNFCADVPGLGKTVWEGKITRLPRVEGEAPAITIWIRDTTATAQLEAALRQEIALLRAISDTSSDVMFAKDLTGRMQFANPAALELIGKAPEDVLGKTDAEVLDDKAAAQEVMANDQRILATGIAEELEETVPMPDGAHRVWLSQKRPYRNKDGQIVGLLGISRDITGRKSAELSVHAAHDTLQRVLDSITDGLAIFDHDWRYTYLSATGAKLLGVRSEEVLGKCLWDLFPHADESSFGRRYRAAVATGEAAHFEDFYPAPLDMWVECHCYPSQDGLSIYFRDVTDRRRAQDAALANERRINALLEATPVGLAYADAAGRILVMNSEAKRIWGSPPTAENVAGYGQYKGWWADHSDRHGQPIAAHEWPTAQALRGQYVRDRILEIEPFDSPGVRRLVLHRSVPILGESNEIVGAVTALTDLTESLEMKRAVVESDHRIRQLANTIPQLAWMADQDGAVHWFNDRWFDYTGCSHSEMVGWGWQSVHDPEMLPNVVSAWHFSLSTGTPFEMTFPLRGKDGIFRPFYTLAEPLKNLQGDVVQWFGTCTDVSTLQRIQEDLTKTQAWLQEGLETGNMVAWEWHQERCEIRYSENAATVLGYEPSTAESMLQTIIEEDQGAYQGAIDRALTQKSALDHLSRRVRPDRRTVIWTRSKGNVLTRADGSVYGIRGILIDVTDQVLREQALKDANDRKDEFLAMLAHELRNPLAPISTAAHLLMMGALDAQRVKSSSEIIGRQVRHMTRLIDDLLDVSRVTRGLVELDSEPVPIKDIVNNAIEQSRPLIEARKHELALRVDSTPAVVLGDRIRLCQVVVNLLNNAAKYTPQRGKIDLEILVGEQAVQIIVADNGIGIDHTLLPHIFELFTQATRTPDRAQGGLGLGLALVDSLIKMHHGRVEAYSDGVGKGSQFVVTLPLILPAIAEKRFAADELIASVGQGGGQLGILIVDDNIDAADMLADLLRLQGHAVSTEYSSAAALTAAAQCAYDLYVLDIGLPDLDGYELVRQLRTMPENAQAVFVALTGYGQAHDKVLSKSAGFDHHLVKPVDFSHLQAIILATQ